MLAPRKKLWSTPGEVVAKAVSALMLGRSGDDSISTVFDVGAGDCRFVIACADAYPTAKVIGIEIDDERGRTATESLIAKGFQPNDETSRVRLIIGNALEQDYSTGSHFFLYLVPRGLRIVLPILLAVATQNKRTIRVITYMSPLVVTSEQERNQVSLLDTIKTSTSSHPDAQWPLYVYDVSPALPESL